MAWTFFVILWIEPETTLKCNWYTINLVDNKTINVIFLGNDSILIEV